MKVPITTLAGNYHVWAEEHGSREDRRLLLLHGGPGANHGYFRSFDAYMAPDELSWIYYDQLGSRYSDAPQDDRLWTIERFVDEVEQVRISLGLGRDDFILLGHSLGGILAIEYALAYQQHLKGLIVSNMMSSCPAYQRYADEVLGPQMDPEVLKRIGELEAQGSYDTPEYMELLTPYYERHVLRKPSHLWPDAVQEGLAHTNQHIYVTMQGPSEFGISGTLADWDRSRDLQEIAVPTLTIGAAYDTMDPGHMEWMASQIPKGSYLHCPEGSHLAMWDDPETYHRGIMDFIRGL